MCIPYSKYVLLCATALWDKFAELHNEKPFDAVDTPELLAEGLFPAVTQTVPLVIRLYTPHSKFIAEKLHNVEPSFDHQFVAMLERVAMLQADIITSPSNDLAEFVALDLGISIDDIAIVRNPIDTTVFSPEGDKAISPQDGMLSVLFVGRLEERKGIHYLVEAIPQVVSQFQQVHFVIIGDDTNTAKGGTSVLTELKQALRRSNCEKYVTFIDRIALTDLPKYYRSADISIVPSVYDNSPYTCLEAMACGTPVIGSSAGGTKEYVVDGESGIIIPPRDSAAITRALVKLLSDDEERRRLSKNARKRAVDCFDRSEIGRQTAILYEKAAQLHASRKKSVEARTLYHHDYRRATEDAATLIDSFDKGIYDLLYQQSYRFRLRHWGRLIKARPKLFAAKVLYKISGLFLRLTGKKAEQYPDAVKRLALSIEVKDKERLSGKLAGKHK
jgi:glycosyltransferase involved in cell wall biosynthesis